MPYALHNFTFIRTPESFRLSEQVKRRQVVHIVRDEEIASSEISLRFEISSITLVFFPNAQEKRRLTLRNIMSCYQDIQKKPLKISVYETDDEGK